MSETTGPISILLGRNVSLVTLYQDCWRHHNSSNKRPTGLARSPEWNNHCRYADVMQHFSNPVTVAVMAILDFQSALSYFRSRGHPVATMCFNSNRPVVWVKSKIGFSRWQLWWPFWISNWHDFSYIVFSIYTSTCCYIVSFNLIRLVTCENMSKTDVHDGGCGGHLGFLIDTILTHFDPVIVFLLQSKFRFKSTKVCEEMSKIDFQDGGCGGHLGFSISSVLAIYVY